jgi:tRNA wybutosine-synthesizing protein 3
MFDHFAKEKSDFLKKKDKSRKGYIDKDIIGIVNLINSKKDFYTTSSCAGRIVLLEMKSKKKNECDWIFSKHDKVTFNEIIDALKHCNKQKTRELPLNAIKREETSFFKSPVWFKQQPIILHVACRNLDAAKKLLDLARKVFKHSGILSITDKKATVEIIGNERIETIVADKNFIVDGNYLKNLVKYANNNFGENKTKSKGFFNIIKKL